MKKNRLNSLILLPLIVIVFLFITLLSSVLQSSFYITKVHISKYFSHVSQAMDEFVFPHNQNGNQVSDKNSSSFIGTNNQYYVFPHNKSGNRVSDKNVPFFILTDNQDIDINFSPYLKSIDRETDIQMTTHIQIDSKNKYWYGFQLKSSRGIGLVKRIGWIDRRPDIHDTPCVRVFIFVNKELCRRENPTHLFQLEIKLGNKSVLLKTAIVPPVFGGYGRGLDKTSVYQAQISFSLKKVLADHKYKQISPTGIIHIKSKLVKNSSFEIELREIKQMQETADGYFMCMHPLYGTFPSKDENFFIEWVEFHLMMGVSEIHLPNSTWKVSANMQNILNMYRQMGKVFVHPNYSPFYVKEEAYRSKFEFGIASMQNNIGINTCFFFNLHRFKYMIVLDLDEFIVPTKGDDYNDIFLQANNTENGNNPIAIGCLWEMYFRFYKQTPENDRYPEMPKQNQSSLFTMNYREHSPPYYGHVKSFLSTSKCGYANSHQCKFPLGISTNKSPLCSTHHHRKNCVSGCSAKIEIDTDILRFRDDLLRRYNTAKDRLKEFKLKFKEKEKLFSL